jgi:hypothetical protein
VTTSTYLFLKLGIFADFVELVWGRDDSPARHNEGDHLQSAHHRRMRPHVIAKLISGQNQEKVSDSSETLLIEIVMNITVTCLSP